MSRSPGNLLFLCFFQFLLLVLSQVWLMEIATLPWQNHICEEAVHDIDSIGKPARPALMMSHTQAGLTSAGNELKVYITEFCQQCQGDEWHI